MKLISPIFHKEMTQCAASKRNYILKCCFLVISFIIVTWVGLADETSELGKALCATSSLLGIFSTIIMVPVMAAGIVSSEAEEQTLPLLFLTQLTPWNIAQDKALARVCFMVYITLLIVPVYACGMLYGGISWAQILAAFGYLLGTILLAAACSILSGVLLKSFAGALFVSYFLLLSLLTIPPIVILSIARSTGEVFMMRTNPFAIVGVFDSHSPSIWEWPWFVGMSAVLYVVAVLLASLKINSLKKMGGVLQSTSLWVRLKSWTGWFRREALAPSQSGSDPVFWREYQLAPLHFLRLLRRFFVLDLLIMPVVLGIVWATEGNRGFISTTVMVGTMMLFFTCIFGSIGIVVLGGLMVPRERKRQTFPVLLSTEIRGRDLAAGYLKTGALVMLDVTLVELISIAVLLTVGNDMVFGLVGCIGVLWFGASCWLALVLVGLFSDTAWVPRLRRTVMLLARLVAVIGCGAIFILSDDIRVFGIVTLAVSNYFLLILAMFMSIRCHSPKASIGWTFLALFVIHFILLLGGVVDVGGEAYLFMPPGLAIAGFADDNRQVALTLISLIIYLLGCGFLTRSYFNKFSYHADRRD